MSTDESTAADNCARHLRGLLRRQGRYRRRWERRVRRAPFGEIHQGAVAEVLAAHLREVGDADESLSARRLKDKVGRALSGAVLSRETLGLFIEAFAMSEQDEHDLVQLWEGSGRISVLNGQAGVPPDITSRLGRPGYLPVAVHEHHLIGEDAVPIRHRTMLVLQATTDGVDRYRYSFDTNALTIHVGQGCSAVLDPAYQVRPDVFSVDILLAEPIDRGETTTIEFTTVFSYDRAPEPILRKAVQGRIENVDLRVEFSPVRLPNAVWWTVWDGFGGPVQAREPVMLGAGHAAHRFVREMENTAAGFSWEW